MACGTLSNTVNCSHGTVFQSRWQCKLRGGYGWKVTPTVKLWGIKSALCQGGQNKLAHFKKQNIFSVRSSEPG